MSTAVEKKVPDSPTIVKAVPPRHVALPGYGLKQAQHERHSWIINPAEGETIEDVIKPEYWAHVAKQYLRSGALIEVQPIDFTYWALLVVVAAGDVAAKVEVLLHKEINANIAVDALSAGATHIIKPSGGKYDVIRISDQQPVKRGFQTREEAQRYLTGYTQALRL